MTSDCKTSLGLRTVNIKDHLVERKNIEPGALVSGRVQRDSHCILLQESREPLIDGEIFVRLDVEQLDHISVLGRREWGFEDAEHIRLYLNDWSHAFSVLGFVLLFLHLGCVLEIWGFAKECFMGFVCNIITWNQLKVKIMKLMVNVTGKFSGVYSEPSITWS